MFRVYDKTVTAKGEQVLIHRGDFETWRETHPVRRMQKYQRTVDDRPITSIVYDERGNFLCSP